MILVDGKPARPALLVPITLSLRPDPLPVPLVLELPISVYVAAGGWVNTVPAELSE